MLLVSGVYAQTTDILSHFKGTNVSIQNVKVDNTGRIVIVGATSNDGVVEFNPNGTSFTYPTTAASTNISIEGFIASYTSNMVLEHFATIGNTGLTVSDNVTNFVFDASNNIYLMGDFGSSLIYYYKRYPTNVAGAFIGAGPTSGVLKINNDFTTASTNALFVKATSGNVNDKVIDLKVDASSLYITGRFETANVEFNPKDSVANPKKLTPVGLGDIFVAKYNLSDLKNVFAYKLGDVNDDRGTSLDIDNSGNIYVSGTFRGTVNMDRTSVAAALTEYGAGTTGDMYLAKYNSSFDHQWSFALGTGQLDEGFKITTDPSTGDFMVFGHFKKDAVDLELNPLGTSTQVTLTGVTTSAIMRYNTNGILTWKNLFKTNSGVVNVSDYYIKNNLVYTVGGFSTVLDAGNSKTATSMGSTDAFITLSDLATGVTNELYVFGGTALESAASVFTNSGKTYIAFRMLGNGDYDPFGSLPNLVHAGTISTALGEYSLCTKPLITTHPLTQTLCAGNSVTLSVAATSSDAMTYVWKKGIATIPTATSNSYTINPLATTDAANYTVEVTNSCGTTTSNSATLTVNPAVTAGMIGFDQVICTGSFPVPLTQTSAPTGGNGTFNYQWQISNNSGATWTDIIIASTSSTYSPPIANNSTAIDMVQQYRRRVSSSTCATVYTNSIIVTVKPNILPGVIAADQTICEGGDPAAFTQTQASSGGFGSGTYTYLWESAVSPFSTYNTISGATSTVYDVPSGLSQTTKYRRRTSSNSCQYQTTTSITITVTPAPAFSSSISGVTAVTPNQSGVSFDVPNQTCMSYNWSVPATATIVSGQGTNSIVVDFGSTGGIITVTETKSTGASNPLNLVVSTTTGTSAALSNQIVVYPNPITSEAYIQSTMTQSAVVSVCDVNGKVLKTITVSSLQEPTEFASTLPKGMYVLKIQVGDQVAMKKIIKE